uniref:Uncharacterized protein n=1 Tax=Meloidogyne enterolobii TaxID=390850 RepID=A0A6V7XN25_MELEN|nr:unnamed protein product [Meloidogyne enterolobii]
MAQNDTGGLKEAFIHFTGGAVGGTAGTALTCPLEVIKTRMQSSQGFLIYRQLREDAIKGAKKPLIEAAIPGPSSSKSAGSFVRFSVAKRLLRAHWPPLSLLAIRSVWKEGGTAALFKGLVPNLIGVTPSKAIYFCFYSLTKRISNNYCSRDETNDEIDRRWLVPNSAFIHMFSAGVGGLIAATLINPIWVVKTRLQLHHGRLGAKECFLRIIKRDGVLGLWRGVTGSYLGIFETVIQFVIYENLRSKISDPDQKFLGSYADKQHQAFLQFMLAGGIAKTFAVIIAYPHEVIRTRLREEGNQLRLRQLVRTLWREGYIKPFYRGLSVQLLRSAPNTAITMFTYELVVHLLHRFLGEHPKD